jgi:hypothetical protein
MRQCKPSDIQALEVIVGVLDQISVELTMIRGKLNKLKTDVNNYVKEQQETIDVQTTHGLSADEQRN